MDSSKAKPLTLKGSRRSSSPKCQAHILHNSLLTSTLAMVQFKVTTPRHKRRRYRTCRILKLLRRHHSHHTRATMRVNLVKEGTSPTRSMRRRSKDTNMGKWAKPQLRGNARSSLCRRNIRDNKQVLLEAQGILSTRRTRNHHRIQSLRQVHQHHRTRNGPTLKVVQNSPSLKCINNSFRHPPLLHSHTFQLLMHRYKHMPYLTINSGHLCLRPDPTGRLKASCLQLQ